MNASENASDKIVRFVFQRSFKRRDCSHLSEVKVTEPKTGACKGCVRQETKTVHLRMCLTCGEVGCCDSSKPKHARKHHEQTGHPLIRSVEPGEMWAWCYLDKAYLTGLFD